MTKPSRKISALALAVTAACASGCSSAQRPAAAVTYRPAAYGEIVNGVGRCYYVSDVTETFVTKSAGLCPRAWTDAQAPLSWREKYDAYYGSIAYTRDFVQPDKLEAYDAAEGALRRTHASDIAVQATGAAYVGSDGRTVYGTTPTMKFADAYCTVWFPGAFRLDKCS